MVCGADGRFALGALADFLKRLLQRTSSGLVHASAHEELDRLEIEIFLMVQLFDDGRRFPFLFGFEVFEEFFFPPCTLPNSLSAISFPMRLSSLVIL